MKRASIDSSTHHRIFSLRFCLVAYLCLTGVNLVVHNRMIDSQGPYIEIRQELHEKLIHNKGPAPSQYRIMSFYSAHALQRLGISFNASYLVLRGVWLFFAALLFHMFLTRYFPLVYVFIGVVVLLGSMPLSYINYYMQEADAANLLFYLAAYLLIRARKDWHLIALLAVAMLNRETPVLIPLAWLFFRWDELKIKDILVRFSVMMVVCFGVYVGLRKILGAHEAYAEFLMLSFNFSSLNSYLYLFLLIGPFLVPAVSRWHEKPKFIRRALLFVPFFLAFHFVLAIFQETRLLLPVVPLMIAGALSYFYRSEEQDSWSGLRPPAWLLSRGKQLYVVIFLVFVGQMWAFCRYFESTHVAGWRTTRAVESYLNQGRDQVARRDFQGALRSFEEGLRSAPDNFDLHYNTAQLYLYYTKDDNKALFHLNQCLKTDPQHARIQEILYAIQKIKDTRSTPEVDR